jgi:hypothetical protein
MKHAILLFWLLLAGGVFASSSSSDASARLERCLENCCTGSGGDWTSGGDCIGGSSKQYDDCSVGCIEEAFGTGGASCCGPSLILLGITAVAALRR